MLYKEKYPEDVVRDIKRSGGLDISGDVESLGADCKASEMIGESMD